MTSSATERKISRARIETFGIKLIPTLYRLLLWLRDSGPNAVCHCSSCDKRVDTEGFPHCTMRRFVGK